MSSKSVNGVRTADLQEGQTYKVVYGPHWWRVVTLRVLPGQAGGYCVSASDPEDVGQTIELSTRGRWAEAWTRTPRAPVPADYTPIWEA